MVLEKNVIKREQFLDNLLQYVFGDISKEKIEVVKHVQKKLLSELSTKIGP